MRSDRFAVGLGMVDFDNVGDNDWNQGLSQDIKNDFGILWEPSAAGDNKFKTEKVSFKWSLPYVTVYWESDGEESNMHDDMDAEIRFIYDM